MSELAGWSVAAHWTTGAGGTAGTLGCVSADGRTQQLVEFGRERDPCPRCGHGWTRWHPMRAAGEFRYCTGSGQGASCYLCAALWLPSLGQMRSLDRARTESWGR